MRRRCYRPRPRRTAHHRLRARSHRLVSSNNSSLQDRRAMRGGLFLWLGVAERSAGQSRPDHHDATTRVAKAGGELRRQRRWTTIHFEGLDVIQRNVVDVEVRCADAVDPEVWRTIAHAAGANHPQLKSALTVGDDAYTGHAAKQVAETSDAPLLDLLAVEVGPQTVLSMALEVREPQTRSVALGIHCRERLCHRRQHQLEGVGAAVHEIQRHIQGRESQTTYAERPQTGWQLHQDKTAGAVRHPTHLTH